jgi:hypothetical protein
MRTPKAPANSTLFILFNLADGVFRVASPNPSDLLAVQGKAIKGYSSQLCTGPNRCSELDPQSICTCKMITYLEPEQNKCAQMGACVAECMRYRHARAAERPTRLPHTSRWTSRFLLVSLICYKIYTNRCFQRTLDCFSDRRLSPASLPVFPYAWQATLPTHTSWRTLRYLMVSLVCYKRYTNHCFQRTLDSFW